MASMAKEIIHRKIASMGNIAKEDGVLKLVRPGRRVELHWVPITAAEVMSRYPRHSITRPDIFEFPWIVVKPEAVLTPGRVFYIVPNRTIYHLLKARENSDSSDQSSSASLQQQQLQQQLQQRESTKDEAQGQVSKKTDAGMTPKHQEHRRRLKHQFLNMSCATTTSVCPTPTEEEIYVKEVRRDVQRVSAPVLSHKHTAQQQGELKRKPSSSSSSQSSKNDTKKGKGKGKASLSSISGRFSDLKFTTTKQVSPLKSCIRKPDSSRKLRQFIVTFNLPDDYVERHTKPAECRRKKYPDYKF